MVGGRTCHHGVLCLLAQAVILMSLPPVARSFSSPFSNAGEWFARSNCQILFPEQPVPKSIIHFCGGFLLGSGAPVAYNDLLTRLSASGNLIIDTPIPLLDNNHAKVAKDISSAFTTCYRNDVLPLLGKGGSSVPVIGLSHSLGGKLMALAGSRREDRRSAPLRAGNIYLAFNNYSFQQSVSMSARSSPDISRLLESPSIKDAMKAVKTSGFGGLLESVLGSSGSSGGGGGGGADFLQAARQYMPPEVLQRANAAANAALEFEFTPSPEETWDLIAGGYGVDENVIFKYRNDDIDQSDELRKALLRRGGCRITMQELPGNHLTPTSSDDNFGRTLNAAINALAMNHLQNFNVLPNNNDRALPR